MPRTHAHPPLELDFEYTTPGASTSTSPFTAAMHCPKRPSRSSTPPLARSAPTSSSSPLHFLYPASLGLLSSKPSSSSSSGGSPTKSKTTKAQSKAAADVSRLLDPAYLPSSARAHSAANGVGVYVDPAGDAHDPDYRHFPAVSPPAGHHNSHGHGHKHSNSLSHGYGAYGQPQRRATSPRPQFDWERAVDESALDDEYPAEEEESYQNHRSAASRPINIASTSSSHSNGNSNSNSYHRRSWSSSYGATTAAGRPRESSFTTTASGTASASASPAWYAHSPTGTASTLPTSYGSANDALEVVPFDDEVREEKEKEEVKEKEGKGEKRKRRRLSKGDKEKERMALQMKERERKSIDLNDHEHVTSALFAPFTTTVPRAPGSIFSPLSPSAPQVEDEECQENDANDDGDALPAPTTSYSANARSPSPCAPHSLRRQWQALALRLRFGLFHAQQRVRRRVGGLTGL